MQSKSAKSFARYASAIILGAITGLAPIASAQNPQQPNESSLANSPDKDDCVASLPFARGHVFCTLDEYLMHLEKQGAIDLPWWREISPGVYERVARATNAQRETATREELKQRFGFKS